MILLIVALALPPNTRAPCSCSALLNMTIAKVEETYIGYRLQVDSASRPAYEARKAEARRRAGLPEVDCVQVVSDWVDGFHDGHLFVLYSPTFTAAQRDSLARTVVHTDWTDERLRSAFRDSTRLDPVEGFWYAKSDAYDLGIVRDPSDSSSFLAVVVSSSVTGWQPGDLKARLTRRPDGRFSVEYRMEDQSTRHETAWLSRGTLLQMYGGVAWGKRAPLRPFDRGTLDPRDPLRPTFRTRGRAVVVTVPSHDGGYRSAFDSIVARHRDALLAADPLIVDLRGDAGGGSSTTSPLLPFIYAKPEREVPGPKGPAVVLASAENLEYFSTWKGSGEGPEWLQDLLGRMGRHYGEMVDFQVASDTTEPWAPDTTFATPRHVAVLTDRGVASAGEAFLLQTLHSPRVTTFGERTWGMIDYQNVAVVRVGCPESGIFLGYPTIAASPSLPAGGLNKTGIVPEVPLDLSRGDPIASILRYYARRARARGSSGRPSLEE
jgi:hypothetical protein